MVHSEVHLLITQAFSQLHEKMSTSPSQKSSLPGYSKRHFNIRIMYLYLIAQSLVMTCQCYLSRTYMYSRRPKEQLQYMTEKLAW